MQSIIKKYCTEEWQKFIDFHSQTLTFDTGDNIINIGEETKGLFFINSGKIKIQTSGANGKERIIRLASDGEVLGHRGFGGSWTYSISATPLTPTEVCFIPLEIFNQAVKANPEFGFYMMMFFAEELRDSERMAMQLPVKNLVASAVYSCYKVFGMDENERTKLSYTLSRKDIANKSGTTYESVVRSLAELNKEGIIKIDGKAIHILDVEQLLEMSTHA